MIISKTPFRISFFGGGTDYPVWYEKNGGSVLSTTINKYSYISTRYYPPFFDHKYQLRYRLHEQIKDISEIKHPSVKECLKFLNEDKGIEMVFTGDLPAMSGIGSSSAFTVGFLNSLYALKGRMVPKKQLALDAIHIEQNLLKENVGSQDQTAAAFGGLNRIDFGGAEKINVSPVILSPERLKSFQDHLMLFFTGFSRCASDIAKEQIKQTPLKGSELTTMKAMVDKSINILCDENCEIKNFGKLLDESWKIKKSLTNLISTSQIDEIYEKALKAGAVGGKLCGAGGGGFILLFAEPEAQQKIKEALKDLLYVPFSFETGGSQIIFNNPQDFI